ncbi:hypothetical protein LZ31DRAFT_124481 [Colletotrichum somersetense]|nr:hypothetical protein LZ31DRAFT_124481 [Colletotrichum somersetense]
MGRGPPRSRKPWDEFLPLLPLLFHSARGEGKVRRDNKKICTCLLFPPLGENCVPPSLAPLPPHAHQMDHHNEGLQSTWSLVKGYTTMCAIIHAIATLIRCRRDHLFEPLPMAKSRWGYTYRWHMSTPGLLFGMFLPPPRPALEQLLTALCRSSLKMLRREKEPHPPLQSWSLCTGAGDRCHPDGHDSPFESTPTGPPATRPDSRCVADCCGKNPLPLPMSPEIACAASRLGESHAEPQSPFVGPQI